MLIVSAFRNIRQLSSTGDSSTEQKSPPELSTNTQSTSLSSVKSSPTLSSTSLTVNHTHTAISGLFVRERLSNWSVTLTSGNVAYCAIVLSAALPKLSQLFFMLYRFVFGLLYPTYRSYKALKYRNHKECARMTMYWVVFAMFTSWEGVLDLFVGFWFPFYSESKILFIFWLSSAYSNGGQLLYEKLVKHQLEENEQRIDRLISRARVLSLDVVYNLWCTFAVYAQQFMIFAVQRMQLALTEYVQTRQEHAITSGDKLVQIMSNAFGMANAAQNVADNKAPESSCRIEEIHDDTDGNGNPFSDSDEEMDISHISMVQHSRMSPKTEEIQISDEETVDNENQDPTFVPTKTKKVKNVADKNSGSKMDDSGAEITDNNNKPKKVKRKKKRIVGIELSNESEAENLESRPRTRGFLKKNSSLNQSVDPL